MFPSLLDQIANGRTDLVFEHLAQGHPATEVDAGGVSLLQWCAYYGDVSAIRFLLAHGANPNSATMASAETGGFMRDCRTKAETPLHRAAAFGTEATIGMLLEAGADREARDMNGDSPLSWASWYARPDSILRLLCFGEFSIRPNRRSMAASLLGEPQV